MKAGLGCGPLGTLGFPRLTPAAPPQVPARSKPRIMCWMGLGAFPTQGRGHHPSSLLERGLPRRPGRVRVFIASLALHWIWGHSRALVHAGGTNSLICSLPLSGSVQFRTCLIPFPFPPFSCFFTPPPQLLSFSCLFLPFLSSVLSLLSAPSAPLSHPSTHTVPLPPPFSLRFFRNLWASILSWSSAALLMGRSRSWGRGAGWEAKLASQPDVWLKCSEDRHEGSFKA